SRRSTGSTASCCAGLCRPSSAGLRRHVPCCVLGSLGPCAAGPEAPFVTARSTSLTVSYVAFSSLLFSSLLLLFSCSSLLFSSLAPLIARLASAVLQRVTQP